MSLTFNTITYTNDVTVGQNGYRYIGPNQTTTLKDRLDLKRADPKPTATYAGNSRPASKFVRTMTDGAGTVIGDAIVNRTWQIPVGADPVEVAAFKADADAFEASAEADDLVTKQLIVHV